MSTFNSHDPQTIEAVLDDLARGTNPILLVDTCALLDVIRSPCRNAATEHQLKAVLRVEEAVDAGRLALCAAVVTRDEWARNVHQVVLEVEREQRRIDDGVVRFVAAARLAGRPEESREGVGVLGVPARVHAWSERLLQKATLIAASDEIKSAAFKRLYEGTPPARRGSDGVGDCTIFETLLALGRGLDDARVKVFLTSNTKDFADDDGAAHPALVSEIEAIGARLVFDWGWAANELQI
jgi:hypothetical protein